LIQLFGVRWSWGCVSTARIVKGKQFGLLTLIAATVAVSLCVRMKD
jgi:hypothetical protein